MMAFLLYEHYYDFESSIENQVGTGSRYIQTYASINKYKTVIFK